MTNDRANIWQIRDAISIMNADAAAGSTGGRVAASGRGRGRVRGRHINIMA